jgi:orotate phosphoribosyltransferase
MQVNMRRDAEWWKRVYMEKPGTYWFHDGNPKRPHAIMRSGSHTKGVFNSRPVIDDLPLMEFASDDLVEEYLSWSGRIGGVEFVVGPQTGATLLAELISLNISRRTGRHCSFASPTKGGEGQDRTMVFDLKDVSKLRGKTVLLCEDVLSTGGSVGLTADAVERAGGLILPFILVLVNRSGLEVVDGKHVIPLVYQPMETWSPENCPLCMTGSEAIQNFKEPANWARLTADYPSSM